MMTHLLFIRALLPVVAAQNSEPVGTPVWFPIFLIILILMLFWWGMTRNSIPTGDAKTNQHNDHADHMEVAIETAVSPPTVPQDLKKIEGIGPVIEKVLHEAGILTFADLAAASVTQLEKIVRHDAGIRVAFPETWAEQAALARDENWEALDKLQDELKGGRHI